MAPVAFPGASHVQPYSEIFRAPGAKGFAAAGFIARLPIAMATMGIVAMLSQTHGEYWLAGAVVGHIRADQRVRVAADLAAGRRHGQTPRADRRRPALSVAAFAGLMLATHFAWPTWTLFVFALLAAAMPSMPAMVRARWTELYRDTPKLGTAFAFESVADELVYMAGSSRWRSGSASRCSRRPARSPRRIFLAVGTAPFVMQKSTEPKVQPVGHGRRRLGHPPAPGADRHLHPGRDRHDLRHGRGDRHRLTKEFGQPAAASFVLGRLCRSARMIVGLVFGALKLKMPLSRQFAVAIAVAALTTLPLLFVGNMPMLALALFLERRVDLADLHHRLRPDRAAGAGREAHRRHHLGDDGHRHRHGRRLVRLGLGDRPVRRRQRLLGFGRGRRRRAAYRPARPVQPGNAIARRQFAGSAG